MEQYYCKIKTEKMMLKQNTCSNWSYAKKILIEDADKYNLCINKPVHLKAIKDIFTSTKKVNNGFMRELWLATNKQSSILWKAINQKIQLQSNYVGIEHKFGYWESEEDAAIKSLNENGMYIFKKKIDIQIVKKLLEDISQETVRPSNSMQQIIDVNEKAGSIINTQQSEYIRWHFDNHIFDRIKNLSNLAKEPSLVKIAKNYLGTDPICTNKQAWISKGKRINDINECSSAAQMYHFDYDSFNFLKVMIYFSDVCLESGPHTYMSTTHKPFTTDKIRARIAPYGRYNDYVIYELFDKSNEVQICGKAGTVILVDTSGFHKGQILREGRTRIMAQIEFVDCGLHFGHKEDVTKQKRE